MDTSFILWDHKLNLILLCHDSLVYATTTNCPSRGTDYVPGASHKLSLIPTVTLPDGSVTVRGYLPASPSLPATQSSCPLKARSMWSQES